MTPSQQLNKDLNKLLRKVGRGTDWLANQCGLNRITVYFFLRRSNPKGGTRNLNYDTGCKLKSWMDNHNMNIK